MANEKWVWLDMDGTIADFYSVSGWLDDIISHRTRPYEIAKPLYNMVDLLEVLFELKTKGWNIGIISWSSKEKNTDFDRQVEKAKNQWLVNECLDLILDKVIVTQYGISKADTCRPYGYGILVDDEKSNRDNWDIGTTIDAETDIIEKLWKMI